MDVACNLLHEKGLAEGCIALEMRYLGVSYFERLRELLPKARFVDAEPILWKLRMLKSAEEIRRMRESCGRTTRIWHNVMRQVHAGMTEKELQGRSWEECQSNETPCRRSPRWLPVASAVVNSLARRASSYRHLDAEMAENHAAQTTSSVP